MIRVERVSNIGGAVAAGGKCGPVDQRGYGRPAPGRPSDPTAICDIGSVEFIAGLDEGLKMKVYLPLNLKN